MERVEGAERRTLQRINGWIGLRVWKQRTPFDNLHT